MGTRIRDSVVDAVVSKSIPTAKWATERRSMRLVEDPDIFSFSLGRIQTKRGVTRLT